MNKIIYIAILLVVTTHIASAQQQVETYSSLEIGYDVSQDLPANVLLGVNGQVYIQAIDNVNPQRNIKNEYINDFLLWVEKGVVSEDLAIGNRDIWLADYVFEPDYKLTTLEEMQNYVKEHKHLPNVIGQAELDTQGYYQINKMLMGQLQNLEELLLHTIAQEKKIEVQAKENIELKALVSNLEKRLNKLVNK
jgi:hypothetical protein